MEIGCGTEICEVSDCVTGVGVVCDTSTIVGSGTAVGSDCITGTGAVYGVSIGSGTVVDSDGEFSDRLTGAGVVCGALTVKGSGTVVNSDGGAAAHGPTVRVIPSSKGLSKK